MILGICLFIVATFTALGTVVTVCVGTARPSSKTQVLVVNSFGIVVEILAAIQLVK
jgi:hypothetical protein